MTSLFAHKALRTLNAYRRNFIGNKKCKSLPWNKFDFGRSKSNISHPLKIWKPVDLYAHIKYIRNKKG